MIEGKLEREEFLRLANNFYLTKNQTTDISRIVLDLEMMNYISSHVEDVKKKFKIAFVFICLNPLYWQYAPEMVFGARQFFLPGHKTEYFFWTDIPEDPESKIYEAFKGRGVDTENTTNVKNMQDIIKNVRSLREEKDIHIIPTEAVEFPYPTLLRYNLFLQEEEKLKEFDYIFFCDIDMQFVNAVGDEILGEGITAAVHPGYHIRKELHPPIESNPKSASYVKRSGKVVDDPAARTATGQIVGNRFLPLYYAGGFQGGKSDKFIEAMKECRKIIESDLNMSYIPRWNDESAWNRYLFDHEPDIVLSPSYIYPDSLIKEYYEPIVWGCSYIPRLVTLTKWFTISKEGGSAVAKMIKQ